MKKKLLSGVLIVLSALCIGFCKDIKKSDAAVSKVFAGNDKTCIKSVNGSGVLSIGKNIKTINTDAFDTSGNLKITNIKVSDSNKYFTAVDGVLYNKDKTKIIYYPNSKKGSKYTIKNSVKTIENKAFAGNKYLNAIIVEDDNPNYKSIDGVVFSKDGKELILYPASKEGAYEVPEGVTSISYDAFCDNKLLTELKLNDSLEEFYLYFLSGCTNLEKLTLPENLKTFYYENGSIIYNGGNLFNLKEVNISDKNPIYASYEGALYTKDYKKMCIMPAGRDKLTIHENTETINNFCQNKFKEIEVPGTNKNFTVKDNVLYNHDLTKVILVASTVTHYVIPASTSDISAIQDEYCTDYEDEGFVTLKNMDYNIKKYDVEEGNKHFVAKNGIVYSKDMTQLCLYPKRKSGAYTIPKSVVSYNAGIFANSDITKLTVSRDSFVCFYGCTSLKEVVFKEGVRVIHLASCNNAKAVLPSTIEWLGVYADCKNTVFYGYGNTGELIFDNTKINGVKSYLTGRGYKFVSLGDAPRKIKSGKAVTSGSNVKITWSTSKGAAGYRISYSSGKYSYPVNTIGLKTVKGAKKTSCTIKKKLLKDNLSKKIYIQPYKVLNGVKIYGKKCLVNVK